MKLGICLLFVYSRCVTNFQTVRRGIKMLRTTALDEEIREQRHLSQIFNLIFL